MPAKSKSPVKEAGCTGPKRAATGLRPARGDEIAPTATGQTGGSGQSFVSPIPPKIALPFPPSAPSLPPRQDREIGPPKGQRKERPV
ncbi:hypothetical protein HMPREF0262_00804 [Clostridium sp. ATCC 29733]|nr:hypothetical protein HMPREF0262_00804 [Clostridium sp. ATCC 29733]